MSRNAPASIGAALAAAACLSVILPAAAAPSEKYFHQQGGNDWRTSAINFDESSPGARGYAVPSYVRCVSFVK